MVLVLSLGAGCSMPTFVVASGDAGQGDVTPRDIGTDGGASDGASNRDVLITSDASDATTRPDSASPTDSAVREDAPSRLEDAGVDAGKADAHRVDATGTDATHPTDSAKKPDAPSTGTLPVALKTAGTYVVLAESAISTVASAALTGNVGLSPAAATNITGFGLTLDHTGTFATSPQVTGEVFAASYTTPTPALLTAAINDMESAFGDASGRTPEFLGVGGGSLAAMTFGPGVYSWTTPVVVTGNIALDGTASDVWILQMAQTLTMDASTRVVLTGGALPANVFWQVSGAVVLDGSAHLEGVLLTATSVALAANVTIKGRILAETAVTIAGGVTISE